MRGYYYEKLEETGSSITVTKATTDPFGDSMQFECYVEDGNERVQIGFILFELDPRQVEAETEIKEGTPNVSLDDDIESLANSLLQDNMEMLESGETAKITLTAETQETPSSEDSSSKDDVSSDKDTSTDKTESEAQKDTSEDEAPEGTIPPTGEQSPIAFALFAAAAAALVITKRKK